MASDRYLINEVAKLWIELGGDSDGVLFCSTMLYNRVKELEEEASSRE